MFADFRLPSSRGRTGICPSRQGTDRGPSSRRTPTAPASVTFCERTLCVGHDGRVSSFCFAVTLRCIVHTQERKRRTSVAFQRFSKKMLNAHLLRRRTADCVARRVPKVAHARRIGLARAMATAVGDARAVALSCIESYRTTSQPPKQNKNKTNPMTLTNAFVHRRTLIEPCVGAGVGERHICVLHGDFITCLRFGLFDCDCTNVRRNYSKQ